MRYLRRLHVGIQAQILTLALLLSLPALLLVGWLSLNRLAEARDAAVRESEATLLEQAESTLQKRAIDKANLYDLTLNSIQRQVVSLSDSAKQAFSTPAADLPPLHLSLFWLSGTGPIANPPADLRLVVNQAQVVEDALLTQVESNGMVSLGYFAHDATGIIVFHDSALITKIPQGFDPRTRPWYIQAKASRRAIWTDTYVDAITGELNITAAVPVYISGRFIGVVGMDILLNTIEEDVLDFSRDSTGYAFLMNSQGYILVRPELQAGDTAWDQTFRTQNLFDNPLVASLANHINRREPGVTRVLFEGGDRYIAVAPMRSTGWFVGLVLPIAEVVEPSQLAGQAIEARQNELRTNLLTVLIVTSIAIVVLALGAARTLTRPLRRLEEGARRIASGQLDYDLAINRHDEIGRLSQSFTSMTHALREKINELEGNAQQMAAINEVSNELKRLQSLAAVLETIPHLLCERLGFDRAALYLVHDDKLEIVSASFGPHGTEMAQALMATAVEEPITLNSSTIEASVVRSRQAVIVDDPWNHPQVIKRKQHITKSNSYVQAPIIGRERVLGIISADYQVQGRTVTVQDASLLLTFAAMVGLTIENAFSFQNLEDLVAQRTVELRDALHQAQAADRLKTQFLASVSHELRTPLNAIIGFSTVLLDELTSVLPDTQREDLETINSNGQYLLDLINDLLDLARIEAGRMELHREPTMLRPIVDSAVQTLRRSAQNRPLTLHVDVSPNLPLLDADPIRLRQILINLLSNALKFTEEGQIAVRAQRRIISPDAPAGRHALPVGDWIVVSVQDTGIGMDETALAGLFQEFKQVHVDARGIRGSGLGLSITRRLVDLHAGHIWVDSKVGVGSTFSFAIASAVVPEPVLV